MTRRPAPRCFLSVAAAVLLAAAGCSNAPTYRKETLVKSLQDILQEEGMHPSVRLVDHTLAVQFSHSGTLAQRDNEIVLGPQFDEEVRKVLTGIHRVVLSSDAPVDFYVMLMSDPTVPGAYLTLVRYVDDVKRANANMIDTPEIYSRTVFDLNFASQRALTLEQYVPRDIRLGEFLSWQLARRIQNTLAEELKGSETATVGRCGGEFRDGEFIFTLNVTPTSDHALDDALLTRMFQTSSAVVAKVLSSYRFDAFRAVRLTHPLTGRNLVLPKTNLDLFR